MKIIHNLKDRVNRLVDIFIPKQDGGFIIDNNAARINPEFTIVTLNSIKTKESVLQTLTLI